MGTTRKDENTAGVSGTSKVEKKARNSEIPILSEALAGANMGLHDGRRGHANPAMYEVEFDCICGRMIWPHSQGQASLIVSGGEGFRGRFRMVGIIKRVLSRPKRRHVATCSRTTSRVARLGSAMARSREVPERFQLVRTFLELDAGPPFGSH